MIVEIISTGTELLLGEIVNTNCAFLAKRLNDNGFDVLFQSTVGDNKERMLQVFETALKRSDIVITTGGLGPTLGDITKEVSATLLKRKLELHQPSLDRIRHFFTLRNIDMPENNIRQAMIPEHGIVLNNYCGTAPGIIIEDNKKIIIHLPGPPFEVEDMFERSVLPFLQTKFGNQGLIFSKILRTFGLGESSLEEHIHDLLLKQSNPTLALLARQGEVIIRITAKASDKNMADQLIDAVEKLIRSRIGNYIYGADNDSLSSVVGSLLSQKNMTIACAESCTGGLLSNLITDVPGSSDYLLGSVVAYSNQIKKSVLYVSEETLDTFGAVSEQTAIEMAEGIQTAFSASLGLSITGIAGPAGATPQKPVGLVYIAITGPTGLKVYKHNFTGNRQNIKLRTAFTALNHLRQYLQSM